MNTGQDSRRDWLQHRLGSIRRLVVKVGTNLLRGSDEGLNLEFMQGLAEQIHKIRNRGIDVILVSSGAVGAGVHVLGFSQPPSETTPRQALAAIGQSRLMHHYELVFQGFGVQVAQVLVTRDNLDRRERYLNARNTFEKLLEWRVLPIVNENDTVAVEELKFGDNDLLSALIAGKVDADLLVLLTDVDSLYDRPPSQEGASRIGFLSFESRHGDGIEAGAGGKFGLGGMRSKLEAVRLATEAGILANISPGRVERILERILQGEEIGTWCEPKERKVSARKRWLAMGKRAGSATILIDGGAEKALRVEGGSLLPSGVVQVRGSFEPGDLISVVGPGGREVARGLTQYSAAELQSIAGKRSPEIALLLGTRSSYEVIHRDDMFVLEGGEKE